MDIDNNGIFSKSDETINLARLSVNDVLIETNSLGEATVKNYKSNQLKINLSQIRTLKGWIPVLGFDQSFVIKDNKTIYIPFKKGKSISGRLVVDKDDKSDIVLQIGSIRVTATSKDGTVYSTLTDVEGNFFIELTRRSIYSYI
jgi:phosphatidate phosphatase APP1